MIPLDIKEFEKNIMTKIFDIKADYLREMNIIYDLDINYYKISYYTEDNNEYVDKKIEEIENINKEIRDSLMETLTDWRLSISRYETILYEIANELRLQKLRVVDKNNELIILDKSDNIIEYMTTIKNVYSGKYKKIIEKLNIETPQIITKVIVKPFYLEYQKISGEFELNVNYKNNFYIKNDLGKYKIDTMFLPHILTKNSLEHVNKIMVNKIENLIKCNMKNKMILEEIKMNKNLLKL